jgi:Histidine kinase-, DNA gyrase B-, and HSP90-like ATPase
MARYVPVAGWRPVETRVRVSDVLKIVDTLGGEKLYGNEPTVAVRELLQNAMDAIQARRRLQSRAPDWGIITVALTERPDGIWFSVEDTGVGMSEAVLVGPLVDFGSSLWRSPHIAEEFPGLAAKGMDAIGRFGIGFFSVFMIGDDVRVTTRRYDDAEADALLLEFRTGLGSRPILSPAARGTAPIDGGTRVEVKLRTDPRSENGVRLSSKDGEEDFGLSLLFQRSRREFLSLTHLVSWLAPASEVSIDAIEFGRRTRAVSAGDWLTVSGAELAERVAPAGSQKGQTRKTLEAFIRPLATSEGQVIGRAALYPSTWIGSWRGAVVCGGLRVRGVEHFLGVVPGHVSTVARDRGRVLLPAQTLAKWATEQVQLIQSSNLSAEHATLCAEIALGNGGSILGLPVARWAGVWLNSEELHARFAREHEVSIYLGEVTYHDYDPVPRHVFEREFEPSDDILFISVLETLSRHTSHLKHHLSAILRQIWGGYSEHDEHDRVVGRANGEDITRKVEVFRRPKESNLVARGSR